MIRHVAIYLFDEIEVLDLGGPFEVFSTASRMKARLSPGSDKPFEVFTIADTARPIRARGGLTVTPAYDFSNHPPIDLLIVPGGVDTAELERPEVIECPPRLSAQVMEAKAAPIRSDPLRLVPKVAQRCCPRCFRPRKSSPAAPTNAAAEGSGTCTATTLEIQE